MEPETTRTIQAMPLSLRAALQPESINAEARTVDLVLSTGARVRRSTWDDGPFYEELSLDPKAIRMQRINNGAPLLDAHSSCEIGSVLGVVQSAELKGGKFVGTVRFARAEDDPKADQAFRKVKDGIIRNVSLGYRVHKLEKVKGGDEQIPVYRATDWEPYEVSLVPMGADDGAKVRSDCPTNPCQVIGLGREKEVAKMAIKIDPEPVAATDPKEEKPVTQAAPKLEAAPALDPVAVREESIRQERARVQEIIRACRAANLPVPFRDELIEKAVSLADLPGRIVEALKSRALDGAGPQAIPSSAPTAETVPGSAGTKLDELTAKRAAEKNISYGAAFIEVQMENRELVEGYAKELGVELNPK